jgi:hypothetical protein
MIMQVTNLDRVPAAERAAIRRRAGVGVTNRRVSETFAGGSPGCPSDPSPPGDLARFD